MGDEVLARLAALVGVVLAGEHERADHAAAVDLAGDLLGVLLDDREQVGEQLALDRREVRGRLRRRGVGVIGAIDRLMRGDRHVAVAARLRRGRVLGRLLVLIGHSNAATSVAQEPVVSRSFRAYDGRMKYRALPVAAAALLVVLSASCSADARQDRELARATLMPRSLDPLRVAASGFKRRERVRVTVTPTGGSAVTKRKRAKRNGSFTVTFGALRACNGFEAVAVGRRGSRASFQFSAVGCPGF